MIVVAVVVATAGVYAYASRKSNEYGASTLVYYQDPGDPINGTPSAQQTDRTVIDAATLLDSRDTAARVAAKIGYHGTPDQLLSQVSITSKPGSDFIEIATSSGSPTQAAAIANGFAQYLVSTLSNGVTHRIESALKLSQTQLAQTPTGPAGDVQRTLLLSQIGRLELAIKVPTLVAKQVDSAFPSYVPTSPKPKRDALFAFIIALVGSIGLAYGLERFDRRLKNPEEMEDAFGRPLLGVLPHADQPVTTRKGQPALGDAFRESIRILRTNIELESLDRPPHTIVVSSAMPGEGKSTVVRNMALAFREAGKSVLTLDLDLRNPSLPLLFGLPKEGPGMTEVLRGELTLDEATVKIPVSLNPVDELMLTRAASQLRPADSNGSGHANGSNGAGLQHPEVSLMRSGSRPANVPAVLASDKLISTLDALRGNYDIVLIDSAPVLAVTDTVPLLRYADASLFVGRLDVTTRDTAKRLMEFLARVPDLHLLGIVANDLSRSEAGSYGYGYGYAYGPYREEHPEGREGQRRFARGSKQTA
jgi:Mrp family chromosome partitioning ATPase/capsular polysaccharide biosynthesis protein